MPLYEDENRTREDLEKTRLKSKCSVCGARLNMYFDQESGKAFIACWDWLRTHHEGIEREVSRYEKEGLAALNIPTRRKLMTEEHGEAKTTALEKQKLPMSGALTQPQAMHILKLVYPDVPESEIIRTAILCRDFGLHPLMKEVYIIGFENRKTGKTDYTTVIGITATRKMAADKKGAYSFIDDSPRAASKAEVTKQFGENSEEERENLVSICKLKGQLGNEAIGFGLWPKIKTPYGIDKGNTQRNMANIRSERQATARLPGEALPLRHLEVMDEAFAEVPDTSEFRAKTKKIIDVTGEIIEEKPVTSVPKEHWCEEHNCAFDKRRGPGNTIFYSHKKDGGGWCNEAKPKDATPKAQPHIPGSAENLPSDEPGAEESQKPQRDPDTLKTINDLYKACNEDFKDKDGKGMQPAQVIKELGVISQSDISDTPADCYRKIAAVR